MSLSNKPDAGCVLCFDDETALAGQAASALGMAVAVVPTMKASGLRRRAPTWATIQSLTSSGTASALP